MRLGVRRTGCSTGEAGRSQAFFEPEAQSPRVETLSEYLTALASESPTPGGGSAATLVAASGAALVAMVGRICAKSPRLAAYRELALSLVARADELRDELEIARERDEAAFAQVVAAQAMSKDSPIEVAARRDTLERALFDAAAEPLHGARLSLEVVQLAARLLEIPNKSLASDVGCAAEFGAAAVAACAYNVRINHRFMKDAHAASVQEHALARYERESIALLSAIRRSLR